MKEFTCHCTDFDNGPVYKLYLLTTDYGFKHNEFYVIAKDPTDAENMLLDIFKQAGEFTYNDIRVVNIKHLTTQVYNSKVGCARETNPDGSDKTAPSYVTKIAA